MTDDWIGDPDVVDPPGFDQASAWQECRDEVDRCGGLTYPDGEPNWRAAFSADPGCCSCPACGASYWAWGRVHRCKRCQFVYPTNWWPMLSWGGQSARPFPRPELLSDDVKARLGGPHDRRMAHAYYRFGHEHPDLATSAHAFGWDGMERPDWRSLIGDWPVAADADAAEGSDVT